MRIVTNELGFAGHCSSRGSANAAMEQLIAVIRQLTALGYPKVLYTPVGFTSAIIAPGYRLSQWLNDPEVARNLKLYFKGLISKGPSLEDLIEIEASKTESEIITESDGARAIGLGVAYLQNCPAVCLRGHQTFDTDPVTITLLWQPVDDVVIDQVQTCCLTTTEQIGSRVDWLKAGSKGEQQERNGRDLLVFVRENLVNLKLANSAVGSIQKFSGNEQYFQQVARHLKLLNAAIQDWDDGQFKLGGVDWSTESESTLNNKTCRDARTFEFPDGSTHVCKYHTKLHGANIRIHFMVSTDRSMAYVGYVGPHLPTSGNAG